MLRATGLSWIPAGADAPILDDITLELARGEWVALLGVSGSGKSTLLHCLSGELQPSRGSVAVDDGAPPTPAQVAVVFQNPDHQFVAARLDRELAFGLEVRAIPRGVMRPLVDRAAAAIGLDARMAAAPASLSAGERQRLALAAALIVEPSYLLADEPTSHLDVASRAAVLAELRAQARAGRGVLLVTQYPDEALAADRLWVLDKGRVTVYGDPRQALSRHDTQPQSDLARLAAAGVRAGADLPVEVSDPASLARRWKSATPGKSEASVAVREEVVATMRRVSLCREDGVPRVAVPHLDIHAGDRVVVAGASGSGKTSLLHLLAGIERSATGDIWHRGASQGALGFLGQSPERMFYRSTAWSELALDPADATAPARAVDLLTALGLDPAALQTRAAFRWSVGEQRRLALAAQLLRRPRLLLLDEPTAGLDAVAVEATCEALLHVVPPATALVVATHDLGRTASLGTRFLSVASGVVREWATAGAFLRSSFPGSPSSQLRKNAAREDSDNLSALLPAWWRVSEVIRARSQGGIDIPSNELEVVQGFPPSGEA